MSGRTTGRRMTRPASDLHSAISVNDDIGAAVRSARATADVGREVDELAVSALANLGFLLFLSGEHAEARLRAQEAVDRPEAPGRPHGYVYALATLAFVEAENGTAVEAESKARQALAAASASGIAETASGGLARLALATALSASGRLADAEREAVRGERLRRQTEPDASHVYALLVLADIRVQTRSALPSVRRPRTRTTGARELSGPGRSRAIRRPRGATDRRRSARDGGARGRARAPPSSACSGSWPVSCRNERSVRSSSCP